MAIILDGTNGIDSPDVAVLGSTSGSITLNAPAVAGSNTQTLVATTGTLAPIVSGTAVASTSGTSIDFTGIPSWVKRITILFSGVSTTGVSNPLIQIGSGSAENTGYLSSSSTVTTVATSQQGTTGFIIGGAAVTAATVFSGVMQINLLNSNLWVSSHAIGITSSAGDFVGGGNKTTSGVLDRVRITTVAGTDTFDAGSINILYE